MTDGTAEHDAIESEIQRLREQQQAAIEPTLSEIREILADEALTERLRRLAELGRSLPTTGKYSPLRLTLPGAEQQINAARGTVG